MVIPVTKFRQLSPTEVGGFGAALQQALGTMGSLGKLQQQQAQIPLTQAQTALTQQKTELAPLAQLIAAQRAKTAADEAARLNISRGAMYAMNQFVKTPEGERMMADNPSFARAYTNIAKGIASEGEKELLSRITGFDFLGSQQRGGKKGSLIPGFEKAFLGGGLSQEMGPKAAVPKMEEAPPQSLSERIEKQQKILLGNPEKPVVTEARPGTEIGGFTPVTEEEIARGQELRGRNIAQKYTTQTTQKRIEAGVSLDHFLKSEPVKEMLRVASQYQGLPGKGKAFFKKYFSPKEYAKFESFQRQFGTTVKGSIKFIEALPSATESMREAGQLFKLSQSSISHDPEAAIQYFNDGARILNAETRALNEASKAYKGAIGYRTVPTEEESIIFKQEEKPGISGKMSGISTEQIINAPKFNTKDEALTWYNSLTRQQQSLYRRQLQGKK